MKYDFDKKVNREHTFSVKYDGRKSYFGTADVIPMWVADMDFETPDFIRKAVISRAKQPIYGYSLRSDSYFDSQINWMEMRHGWQVKKEWIFFSPGIVPALNMIIQAFTEPGDKVLVQPPVYHPFFFAIENNHRELVENPLLYTNGRYEMDFDDLEGKLSRKVKLLLLSNPHNPVGRTWTPTELIRLAKLCVKYRVLVVSDEIHCDLVLPGFRHTPLAMLSPEIAGLCITCVAPSKTFNLAGLATSSVIIQNTNMHRVFGEFLEKLRVTMGNLFGTVASVAAYTNGAGWLDQLLAYLVGNVSFVQDYLEHNIPDVRLVQPQATYLLWLDFNDLKMEPDRLQEFLIKKAGVGFNDGRTFGTGGKGFHRMNVACPKKLVEEALGKIKFALEKL